MKNFPDHDPFNELEKRLESYTEQPDELVWDNIDAALRPNRTPVWAPWTDRATMVVFVLLFGSVMVGREPDGVFNPEVVTTKNADAMSHDEDDFIEKDDPSLPSQSATTLQEKKEVNERSTVAHLVPYEGSAKRLTGKKEDLRHGKMYLPESSGITFDTDLLTPSRMDEEFTLVHEPTGDSAVEFSIVREKTDSALRAEGAAVKASKRLPKRSHAFYFTATPMLSFQRILPVTRDGVVVSEFLDRPILSTERFGFNVDAGVQGYLTKRFEYYAGISMYQQWQTLHYSYQTDEEITVNSNGENRFTITPTSSVATVRYQMVNLGLQAGLLYHLYGKKLTHKVGAGILFQQGLKKNGGEVYENAGSNYFSYQVFYRNELRLNRRLRLYIQPSFVQSVHANEKLKAPFNIKPYRAGLGFGVLYDF